MTEATIVSSTGYEFQFRAIAPVDNDKVQPSISIPLPNSGPDDQLLFRFAGQSETVDLEFILYPSTTDLSGGTAPAGTYPDGVKTILQQKTYLRDVVFSSEYSTSWSLLLSSFYSSAISGVIEQVSFNKQAGGAFFSTGRFSFKRGKLAGT